MPNWCVPHRLLQNRQKVPLKIPVAVVVENSFWSQGSFIFKSFLRGPPRLGWQTCLWLTWWALEQDDLCDSCDS